MTLSLTLLVATVAVAIERPAVAVLYFDNNTGKPELDVLQKGFADMMVTDLSAVQEIQVVEREKLQALVDELKLQRTKYFDPATAQKLGKGVGAKFAVTGAFLAVDPQMRVDIRMIEIANAKVVLGDQVVGESSKLFDLQQQLVNRFVAGLNVKLGVVARSKTRVPDIGTLLEYSKGLDLADQGKLDEASKALAEVIKRAPAFGLARERRDQILLRLKEAAERRKDALSESGETLMKDAEQFLQERKLESLSTQEAGHYLGYRQIKGRFILRALRQHLSKNHPHPVLLGHEPQALGLIQGFAANARALMDEHRLADRKHSQVVNGVSYPRVSYQLPQEDQRRATESKLGSVGTPVSPELELAQFLILGRANDGEHFTISPAPGVLSAPLEKEGFALVEAAFAELRKKSEHQQHFAHMAAESLDTWAEALLLRGKLEEAVAKWQQILDTWPTGTSFERYERRIKEELGLPGTNAAYMEGVEYPSKLEACDEWGIRKGIDNALHQAERRYGIPGIKVVMEEFDKKCGSNAELRRRGVVNYVFKSGALASASHGDCASYQALMQKYLDTGGSKGDLDGYNRNWAPHCQK
ncbi:MAG: hypothetical protein HYZ28_01405 [Myxococcales bacterium]|nr:hypothetical protein [Myxococcales bacterium]